MENQATVTPAAPAAPVTSVTKTSNKSLIITFVVVAVLIIIAALAALYATGAFDALLGRKATSGTIDASQPNVAVSQLNNYAIKSVEDIDTNSNATLDFTSVFAQIGLDTSGQYSTAELAVDFTITSQGVDVNASLSGSVKNEGDDKYSLQINGNINGDNEDIGNIKVPFDLVLIDQTMYLKIGDVPSNLSDLSPELALVAKLFEDEWIQLDLEEATQLSGTNASVETKLSQEDKDQLLTLWRENPPFENGRSIGDRTINGITLKCMLTDLNDKAFTAESVDLSTFQNFPTIEICNKGAGQLPVFFGFDIPETDGTSGTVGITIISYGKEVTISAPEDAKTLDELLGGFGI